jgi:hypothetical protein
MSRLQKQAEIAIAKIDLSLATKAKRSANGAEHIVMDDCAGVRALSLTEDTLAAVFAKRYGTELRFDHDAGRCYQWDGMRWARSERISLSTFAER